MPRKPTWDDVPRRTDGRFAQRMRYVKESLVAEDKPGFIRTSGTLFWSTLVNLFFVVSMVGLLHLAAMSTGVLVSIAMFVSFPLNHALFRFKPWWLVAYTVVTVGLVIWMGIRT